MKLSIIIPVYNEEKVIASCLESLKKQTEQDFEVIVVDDGSTDSSRNFATISQNHKGPGAARNLGAKEAKGKILVFVDSDMEFDPNFLKKLIVPIEAGTAIGTFSKDEYLLNKNSALARCWNLNLGRKATKMHPENYPDKQNVFRAILKSEFDKSGGFDENIGYTDDWSISRKLGQMASVAEGAIYYHRNPETLKEVWTQSRWFGKNEFLTGNLVRKIGNLARYNPASGLIMGIIGAVRFKESDFLVFKIVYDTGVFVSVLKSFAGEQKAK